MHTIRGMRFIHSGGLVGKVGTRFRLCLQNLLKSTARETWWCILIVHNPKNSYIHCYEHLYHILSGSALQSLSKLVLFTLCSVPERSDFIPPILNFSVAVSVNLWKLGCSVLYMFVF